MSQAAAHNPALRLYERTGFQQIDELSGSLTMLLRLQDLRRSTLDILARHRSALADTPISR